MTPRNICSSIARALVLCIAILAFCTDAVAGDVYVKGYYRNDGTYVQPHFRSAPDGNPYNNWSFPGNVNPYTGKVAPGNPDTYLKRYLQGQRSVPLPAPSSPPTPAHSASPQKVTPAPSHALADPAIVAAVQRSLSASGFDPGPIDGVVGERTRLAIRSYQRTIGLTEDGRISATLIGKLLFSGAADAARSDEPRLPAHAKRNAYSNGWDCDRGYYRQGQQCLPVQPPKHASLNFYGNGWDCDRGYFRQGQQCLPVQPPKHASLNFYGNGWDCDRGYYRQGQQCLPVQPPKHASLNFYGNGWNCDRGYYRQGQQCLSVQPPEHATLNFYGNGWDCEQGYQRVGSKCEPASAGRSLPAPASIQYRTSTRSYDVSGYGDDGYVYGEIDASGGDQEVSGYLYLENGDTVYFDGEWSGQGEIEGYDEDGNYYNLEVD